MAPPKTDKKKKKKMQLAKDGKQLALAVIVFVAFFAKLGHMGYTSYKEKAEENKLIAEYEQKMANEANNPQNIVDGTSQTEVQVENTANQPVGDLNQADTNKNSISDVDIIIKPDGASFNGKRILIPVITKNTNNPFVPYKEEMPASMLPKFPIVQPPEILAENSEAQKLSETTVSGILYDQYSPSAILKINGIDHLVKRGDVINRYKILVIDRDKVVVQLGKNIFRAGVGELLAQNEINYNNVPNLNRRFGGSNDIQINVKKY